MHVLPVKKRINLTWSWGGGQEEEGHLEGVIINSIKNRLLYKLMCYYDDKSCFL